MFFTLQPFCFSEWRTFVPEYWYSQLFCRYVGTSVYGAIGSSVGTRRRHGVAETRPRTAWRPSRWQSAPQWPARQPSGWRSASQWADTSSRDKANRRGPHDERAAPQCRAGPRPSSRWQLATQRPAGTDEQDTRRDGRRRPTDARPLGNRQPKHAAIASPGCADTARVHNAQL